jgi:hypothetical protein
LGEKEAGVKVELLEVSAWSEAYWNEGDVGHGGDGSQRFFFGLHEITRRGRLQRREKEGGGARAEDEARVCEEELRGDLVEGKGGGWEWLALARWWKGSRTWRAPPRKKTEK